jgi:hypothetical protein
MKKEKTKTVFRVYSNGEIIALFPQVPADIHGSFCMSYMHVGQHGGADTFVVVKQTRLAKPKEYAALLKELKQLGYKPRIAERCTYRNCRIRREQCQTIA